MKTPYRLSMVICLALSGCTLYEKPEVPMPQTPEKFEVTANYEEYAALNNRWWENFNNKQLNDLVEKAVTKNYNYQIALMNIDIAQTYVLQNMTLLFPQLGLDYELSRNKSIVNVGNSVSTAPELTTNSSAFNLQTLTATATYELDIWNQVHNSVDQAKADKSTAASNANVIRLTLISSVVNTYFQISALESNIKQLRKQYKAAYEIAELTQVQYQAGLVDDSLVYQAKNQAESYFSTLEVAEKQCQIYRFTLAYLLGEYPEQFAFKSEGKLSDLKFKELLPEAIPSLMLATRPDIQAAFSSVQSFGYIEKQNIANFLPNISLSGTFGYANNAIANLINSSNVLWNFGLSGIQALVDYPQLYAQWKRSQIQYESAILSYNNTLINAFAEVDGAIVSYKRDDQVRNSFNRQYLNQIELLDIAKAHYASGLTDYIDYLSNKLNALQSQINLTNQQLIVTQDIVLVYKTLGLGINEHDDDNG